MGFWGGGGGGAMSWEGRSIPIFPRLATRENGGNGETWGEMLANGIVNSSEVPIPFSMPPPPSVSASWLFFRVGRKDKHPSDPQS